MSVCAERGAWNDFVAAAGGSLLQSWQWGEFRRSQGWRVLRLWAVTSGKPRAAMQILARDIPPFGDLFYASEGPVFPAEDWAGNAALLGPLLAEARRRAHARGAFVLRVDPLTPEPGAVAALAARSLRRSPENVQPAATAVVDLDRSADELLARLDKGARYLVRRSQRDGVAVRAGRDDEIAAFSHMVRETGRRKGFGVRGDAYMAGLTAMLRAEHSGDFLVAELDGAMIGAILTGTFGSRSAALYAAGNDAARKTGAQYLLHWSAMLRARELGCRLYDFRGIGAADDPADHWAGMTFFKQRFGTRREDLPGAWDDVYRPLAYHAFLLAQRARRELPARLRALRGRAEQAR